MEPSISRSVLIAADSDVVWGLVSDLPRMGEFSPENVGGHWVGATGGPSVGARFRGVNRNGDKLWRTKVTVVACEPARELMFDVRTPFGMRVSRWQYLLERAGSGCLLTENWYRVGNLFVQRHLGPRVTGQADRPGFNAHSIEHTLAKVKALAESQAR